MPTVPHVFRPMAAALLVAVPALTFGEEGRSAATGGFLDGLNEMLGMLDKGGTTMWFLGLLSVAMMAFTIERLLRLRRKGLYPSGLIEFILPLYEQRRYREIQQACEETPSALGRIANHIVLHRSLSSAELNQAISDIGGSEIDQHVRRAYPLAVIANMAPLVGLFGTVIGMIEAFAAFRTLGETGDPSVFAGSISKALVTTAVGLIIAIPGMGLYQFFKGRALRLGQQLEGQAQQLLEAWILPTSSLDDESDQPSAA